MAIQVETLVATLEARLDKYEKSLAKAVGTTDRQFRAIETRGKKMEARIESSAAGVGTGMDKMARAISFGFKAFLAFEAVKSAVTNFAQFTDAATRVDNALKVAGLSGKELDDVYQHLFESARKNSAPLESLATLYGRVATVQKQLGVSSQDLLSFTDHVALALRVSGTSAEQASGALLQLGQALGSGVVHAEEFNSIVEGTPAIAQAAAAGIKEAGGSVSKLKELVNAGKLSNQAFFRGFEAGSVILEQRAKGATQTFGGAMENLQTALIDAARDFEKATGASARFIEGINTLSGAITRVDVSGLIEKLRSVKKEIDATLQSFGNSDVFKKFNELVGITDAQGNILNPDVSAANDKIASLERDVKLLQERIELNTSLAIDNTEALARLAQVKAELASVRAAAADLPSTVQGLRPDGSPILKPEDSAQGTNGLMGGSTIRGGARHPTVTPVSIKTFPATSSTSSSKSGATKQDDFADSLKSMNAETQALNQQRAAMANLNGTSADYAQRVLEIEKAQELLSEAQKDGKAAGKELSDVQQLLTGDLSKLSPEAQKQALAMRQAALGYADASTKLDALKKSQDDAAQSAKDFIETEKDVVSGAMSDIRSAFEDGKITAQEWGGVVVNMLNKVADKLQELLVDQLFKSGGLFGSLFGGATSDPWAGLRTTSAAPVTSSPLAASALTRAPKPVNAVSLRAARSNNVHVTVGFENDDLNLKPDVTKIARSEAVATGKAGLDQYRRGQFRQDWEQHAASRRVKGVI